MKTPVWNSYFKTIKNARVRTLNGWWFFYVLLTIASLMAVSIAGKKLSANSRYHLVLILSVIELIILRIYKFSLKDIRSDYNYFNELPCYLCNQSTLLCIIASLSRSIPVMAYCVSIGTLGAVLAFVMPDSYNRDQLAFSKQAYGFYGYHGLLIVTCMSFYALGLYEPKLKDSFWPAVLTFILAFIAHIVNLVLRRTGLNDRSNYVFTYHPDNAILQKMYDVTPVRLWYMWPILPIFTVYSYVLFWLLSALK